jgi:hypothetical protein
MVIVGGMPDADNGQRLFLQVAGGREQQGGD